MIKTNSKFSSIVNNLNEEEVIKMYLKDKLSSSKIAESLNCLPYHITKILEKNNVQRCKKNNVDIKKIIKMYDKNFSLSKIAKEVGLKSTGTIRKILIENNINPTNKSKRIDAKEVIKFYQNKNSLSEIASLFNVSPQTIKDILIENNITLRTKKTKKGKIFFNKNSIYFFKYFDKLYNTKGYYGVNEYWIEEIGYSLDYINFDKKIIIEWDEEHHKYKKTKDKIREKEIRKHFSDFEFYRIQE